MDNSILVGNAFDIVVENKNLFENVAFAVDSHWFVTFSFLALVHQFPFATVFVFCLHAADLSGMYVDLIASSLVVWTVGLLIG